MCLSQCSSYYSFDQVIHQGCLKSG